MQFWVTVPKNVWHSRPTRTNKMQRDWTWRVQRVSLSSSSPPRSKKFRMSLQTKFQWDMNNRGSHYNWIGTVRCIVPRSKSHHLRQKLPVMAGRKLNWTASFFHVFVLKNKPKSIRIRVIPILKHESDIFLAYHLEVYKYSYGIFWHSDSLFGIYSDSVAFLSWLRVQV